MPTDPSDFSDLDNLIESLKSGTFNDQFSQEFIDYTNKIADEIEARGQKELDDETLMKLAQALGSYVD